MTEEEKEIKAIKLIQRVIDERPKELNVKSIRVLLAMEVISMKEELKEKLRLASESARVELAERQTRDMARELAKAKATIIAYKSKYGEL